MSDLFSRLQLLNETLWGRLGLEGLHRFLVANKGLMFYLVAVAVVAFGYDLSTFSLKIDSEYHALTPGPNVLWITQGRWAMYYLNAWLLPDAVMPFLPMLTGLLGLACGVLLFLLSLSEQRTVSNYLAAPLAIGCPLLAFAFYFTTLGYGLGFAFAAAGAGLYALTRWRWSSAAWAIVCFAFAIGIYQTAIFLMPVLFGFYLVVLVIAVPRLPVGLLLRRLGGFCIVMLFAYGVYELINTFTLHAYNLPYAHEYLQRYLTSTTGPSYWPTTISRTLAAALAYYTGGEEYYLYPLRILAVLFCVALTITILRILAAPQSVPVKAVGALALVGSLCVPLSMHLVNSGYMPPRTVLGVPFAFAGLVFSASFNNGKVLKAALGLLVFACFFKFAAINSRYALTSQLNWKADQDLSLMILQRIHLVLQPFPTQRPPFRVALVGMLDRHESPLYIDRDVIGLSFYNQDGGSAGRMVGLWRSMRQFDFWAATAEQALAVAERAVSMPVWPAEGSVNVINGVIVVKLGEYTPHQMTFFCQSAPTSEFCQQHMAK